ncbi:MAG: GlsB/YeaQ/YmgE family stress response membrane protein [Paracoccaceae bacterium]
MPVLAMIIIGAAAGFIATRMVKMDANVITTVSIGVLGAIIGGGVLRLILVIGGWMAGFVGAVLGALLLIWLWRTYGPTS